jgi:[NiFe] hydrogenase diaphorase moiety large subunit
VFEGMTLCAGIVGAREGFLYLRGEYRYLLEHLEAVLRAARAGAAGQGHRRPGGFDFDIQIHLGAGAYICGEESALIESLEGKRGVTRKRPPFPVTEGYLDRPTVVNNVETFLAAARIAEHGGYWFRSEGTDRPPAARSSASAATAPAPASTRCPSAPRSRRCSRPAAPSGRAGGAGLRRRRGLPDRDEFEPRAGLRGPAHRRLLHGLRPARDLLEMVRNFAHFFATRAAASAPPAGSAATLLRDLVEKVRRAGSQHDLDEMRRIAEHVMRRASHCGLGHTAPNHVLNTLDKFPAYERSPAIARLHAGLRPGCRAGRGAAHDRARRCRRPSVTDG